MNAAYIQKTIEEIIVSLPQDINDVREQSAWYVVEDALKILSDKSAVGFSHSRTIMATTKGPATGEGREDLVTALLKLDQEKPVQAVYTCCPLSFVITTGLNPDNSSNLTLVDTHCVPSKLEGNDNAAIVQLNYNSINKAANDMASWIEDRLAASGIGKGA